MLFILQVSILSEQIYNLIYLFYPYTLAVSPSFGGSEQHKETTKTMEVLLHSFSNDKGSGQVWMALLEQQSPSSPVFHNLRSS